jgi:hypothetical protein
MSQNGEQNQEVLQTGNTPPLEEQQSRLPLGTIAMRTKYGAFSQVQYRKWKTVFPQLICPCKLSLIEPLVIDDYLLPDLLLVHSKNDETRVSIISTYDVSPFLTYYNEGNV